MKHQLGLYSNQVNWHKEYILVSDKDNIVRFDTRVHFRTEVLIRLYVGSDVSPHIDKHIANIQVNEIPSELAGKVIMEMRIFNNEGNLGVTAMDTEKSNFLSVDVIIFEKAITTTGIEGIPHVLILPFNDVPSQIVSKIIFP